MSNLGNGTCIFTSLSLMCKMKEAPIFRDTVVCLFLTRKIAFFFSRHEMEHGIINLKQKNTNSRQL